MIAVKRRWLCHFIAALFAFLIVAPVTWVAADRRPAFMLTNGSTLPVILTPGKPYQLVWDVQHIQNDCDVVGYRVVIDSEGTPHPTSPIQRAIFADYEGDKKYRSAGSERVLQSNIREGFVTIRTWADSKCNFIQRWFNWPVRAEFPEIRVYVRP